MGVSAQPSGSSGPGESAPVGDAPDRIVQAARAGTLPQPPRASNRFGLDYREQARLLGVPILPSGRGIVDFHCHAGGLVACRIFHDVARTFGVERLHSMVAFDQAVKIQSTLGDFVRHIAFPNFRHSDRLTAMSSIFLEDIRRFHAELGSKMVKFWNAPRLREVLPPEAHAEVVEFDSPWRVKQAELAQSLGMMFMVHVADPDTWFKTKYKDEKKFLKKREHYRGLEVMLRRFPGPWVAAHMGGSPEDLAFLSELLERHDNLYLDTSATKWVVRELSAQPLDAARDFFIRWRTRIVFGSDIVSLDDHLAPRTGPPGPHPMADLADSPAAAWELYASRYFALRAMLETGAQGESPIADPDLMLIDPARHGPLDAPTLRGLSLPKDVLADIYLNNANRLWA